METSKVFFTNMRSAPDCSILQKLEKLILAAGIDTIDFKNKYTAIKLHFGEPGNLAYLRPNYAKVVADVVRRLGGRPFVTDANTLYVGRRANALEHLDAAYENGYNPFTTGCQVIIADGLKGTDDVEVPVSGEYVTAAKIGRAIMDADIVISLNHFKCHEATGIGGALKNLGMGCGSRAGKMEMHYAGKPVVNRELCISCGHCRKNCAHDAISFPEKKAMIDHDKCVGCGRCIGACTPGAVTPSNDESFDVLNKKISEYALAVAQGRPGFHISLVIDVSPFCDCHAENDTAIIPDVGIFASFDPVALDMACADAVNQQPVMKHSRLAEMPAKDNHFATVHPSTNYMVGLEHGEAIGLGSTKYELISIDAD